MLLIDDLTGTPDRTHHVLISGLKNIQRPPIRTASHNQFVTQVASDPPPQPIHNFWLEAYNNVTTAWFQKCNVRHKQLNILYNLRIHTELIIIAVYFGLGRRVLLQQQSDLWLLTHGNPQTKNCWPDTHITTNSNCMTRQVQRSTNVHTHTHTRTVCGRAARAQVSEVDGMHMESRCTTAQLFSIQLLCKHRKLTLMWRTSCPACKHELRSTTTTNNINASHRWCCCT